MFWKKSEVDFLPQVIDWELKSADKTIILKKRTLCEYSDQIITFKDDLGSHEIDIKNKTYKRITDDYKMFINFKEQVVTFEFKNQGKCSIDIEANMIILDQKIICEYNIDGDKKSLIITRKE